MSSHHFVKEGQEPALFIVEPISLQLIQPLLEWAPTVMVLGSALDAVLNWGIKIDVVLAKPEQVGTVEEKVLDQAPVKIISFGETEDPIITGFYFLVGNKQGAVNMIADLSNSISVLVQDLGDRLDVVLLNEKMKWSFMRGGQFEKWFPAQSKLKVQGVQVDQAFSIHGLQASGLDYEVTFDNQIIIKSNDPFWVGEGIGWEP